MVLDYQQYKCDRSKDEECCNAAPAVGSDLQQCRKRDVYRREEEYDPAVRDKPEQNAEGGCNTFSAPEPIEYAESMSKHRG